jgi:phosphoglycolate phosphatase-like HAD superfamily hydrolase
MQRTNRHDFRASPMKIGSRAVVVGFDGLLVRSLELRSQSVVEGLATTGVRVDEHDTLAVIAGRTLDEAVRIVGMGTGIEFDETMLDIASHRAHRVCASLMDGSLELADGAIDWVQRSSISVRVVVRADSVRRDVERVLEASGLAPIITLVRCSDDEPLRSLSESMFVQSYGAIATRLGRLGVLPAGIRGLECALEELCSSVQTLRVHRVTSVTESVPDALQLF